MTVYGATIRRFDSMEAAHNPTPGMVVPAQHFTALTSEVLLQMMARSLECFDALGGDLGCADVVARGRGSDSGL